MATFAALSCSKMAKGPGIEVGPSPHMFNIYLNFLF